jgi:hypothetical protein
MSDNKLTDGRGLYQVEDKPDAAPQGSVSQPVSAMGRADAPLRECPFCGGEATLRPPSDHTGDWYAGCLNWESCTYTGPDFPTRADAIKGWNRRDREAARVAEAVAAERARLFMALFDKATRREDGMRYVTQAAAFDVFFPGEP